MRIDIDVTMDYQLSVAEAVLLMIEAAATDGQSVLETDLDLGAADLHRVDDEAGSVRRIWALAPSDRLTLRYRAKVEVSRPRVALETLSATPLHRLPGPVLDYLQPSRFCQSDLLIALVAQKFGDLGGGARIAAILDWVATEISYVPGSSNAMTTARDTFVARQGVCRDYTHLVCSLARAARIPARYTSVYCPNVTPPDFHAVAEVWLDGAWHPVDATGMSSADGLVVIASGRDAGDVAFMETEHWATLLHQAVRVTRGSPGGQSTA